VGDISAILVQQSGSGKSSMMEAGKIGPAGGKQNRAVAVFFFYPVKLADKSIIGLIPGYAFKPALPALSYAFLGIKKPLRVMYILLVGPASETCSELFRLRGIISFNP
jgi:hypothetical protein